MTHRLTLLAAVLLALVSCGQKTKTEILIIPQPKSVTVLEGSVSVKGLPVSYDSSVDAVALKQISKFASDLSTATGAESALVPDGSEGIVFSLSSNLGEEAYTLKVAEGKVLSTAGGTHGVLYSIQTIKQMLPVGIYNPGGKEPGKWTLPCCEITDSPRFAYRGMHKDDARHFFPIEEVKKYLDIMAIHKMNTLHWHLTDDQGWRIEIKAYPRLTEIGAYRDSTLIGSYNDNLGYEKERYGGFYTQEEIKEVVAYAADLGITVIPEIDLPGHMVAALASYPELGCAGGPYGVRPTWGVAEEVLCPGKEITFTFLETVLTEVMELFPSEYIHIGGDECPKVAWESCPDCQKRIKELGLKDDAHHKAEAYLQNYVTSRIQDFLNAHGRKIIGWDEILEGKLAEGATVMSWRGIDGGIEAAKKGFDAIMTPNTYAYIDYYQSRRRDLEPLGIGGYLPIEKVYFYEPWEGLPASARSHILGVQANLWTEYISRCDHLEYMLLPRMCAIAEIGWTLHDNKDFDRFKTAIVQTTFPILDRLGYSYCKDIIGEYGLPGLPGGTNK